MDKFIPNIPALQILWFSEVGWELECIDVYSLRSGQGHTVAIGCWSKKKNYYRYPVTVSRTKNTIVISDYRRPPEWQYSDWKYIEGTLSITLSSTGVPQSVSWERADTNEKSILAPEKDWKFFGSSNDAAIPEPRGRIQVDQIHRPLQALLRKLLLSSQKRCVISGCGIEDCLEAAHILPVKNGGIEVQDNMLLLRADLHKLYDAGLISINVCSGKFRAFAAPEILEYVKLAIPDEQEPSEANYQDSLKWVLARRSIQPVDHHLPVDA